ncbi:hypothetical protein L6V77_31695 [Myxococcota bacterium]|nr:hypothetical protein [Myxococcota bacterium]
MAVVVWLLKPITLRPTPSDEDLPPGNRIPALSSVAVGNRQVPIVLTALAAPPRLKVPLETARVVHRELKRQGYSIDTSPTCSTSGAFTAPAASEMVVLQDGFNGTPTTFAVVLRGKKVVAREEIHRDSACVGVLDLDGDGVGELITKNYFMQCGGTALGIWSFKRGVARQLRGFYIGERGCCHGEEDSDYKVEVTYRGGPPSEKSSYEIKALRRGCAEDRDGDFVPSGPFMPVSPGELPEVFEEAP